MSLVLAQCLYSNFGSTVVVVVVDNRSETGQGSSVYSVPNPRFPKHACFARVWQQSVSKVPSVLAVLVLFSALCAETCFQCQLPLYRTVGNVVRLDLDFGGPVSLRAVASKQAVTLRVRFHRPGSCVKYVYSLEKKRHV